MNSQRPSIVCLLGLALSLSACFRDPVETGLGVEVVVQDARTTGPFGSPAADAGTAPRAGISVYMVAADTPYKDLARVQPSWSRQHTDQRGYTAFAEAEGMYHLLVDANGNDWIDARALNVPSGMTHIVNVDSFARPGGQWLAMSVDQRVYMPGATVAAELNGYVPDSGTVRVELWHNGLSPEQLWTSGPLSVTGDVAKTFSVELAPGWPTSPTVRSDDFLLAPVVEDDWYEGARFSVRPPGESTIIDSAWMHINDGDVSTSSRNVTLRQAAEGAVEMAFSENADAAFLHLDRYRYAATLPWTLSQGQGEKTLYAWFFDTYGDYYGPVDDSIVLLPAHPPLIDSGALVVTMNPPGDSDLLEGLPGAGRADHQVSIYSDPSLGSSSLLAHAAINDDGSFGPLDIGDNQVFKPADVVFVLQVDPHGRASQAVTAYNDATPPHLRPEEIHIYPVSDPTAEVVGGGRAVEVEYHPSITDPARSDMVAGEADFEDFGVDGAVPLTETEPGVFHARATVTWDPIHRDDARVRLRIRDAAWNQSPWVASEGTLRVDTIPPPAPWIIMSAGGDGALHATWDGIQRNDYGCINDSFVVIPCPRFAELDATWHFPYWSGSLQDWWAERIRSIRVVFTDVNDRTQVISRTLDIIDACNGMLYLSEACWNFRMDWGVNNTWLIGQFPFAENQTNPHTFDLPNCKLWEMEIALIDEAGNIGPFSNTVTEHVKPRTPSFSSWAGLDGSGESAVVYSISPAPYQRRERDAPTWHELFFRPEGEPSWNYTAANITSPAMFESFPRNPYIGRIRGIPSGTTMDLTVRAHDPAADCYSDYAEQMTAVTDLRILGDASGVPHERFGGALAAIDDIDGDGLPDLLVGASGTDDLVRASGLTATPFDSFGTWLFPDEYSLIGRSLAAVNLDGDPELEYLVGAPLDSTVAPRAGAVYVYDDDDSLLTTLYGQEEGEHFGFTIARIGDLSDPPDGIDAFAVGGFGCRQEMCGVSALDNEVNPTQGPGRVTVFDGATLDPLYVHEGPGLGDYFGAGLAGGGDYNGDGVPDYAIGAPGIPHSGRLLTAVTVYSGATGMPIAELKPSAWRTWRFGTALAFVPDIDGDGRAGLAVGSPSFDARLPGVVHLFTAQSEDARWHHDSRLIGAGASFGVVIDAGGDINGDGIPDIAVGAPGPGQDFFYGAGAAFLLDGATGRFLYEMTGIDQDGALGYGVLMPGDLDGTWFDEWVVSSPTATFAGEDAGRLYILTTSP